MPESLDPVLDSATVLGLVRHCLPGAHRVTGVDESGGEARTYAVDGDVIVKVQRPQKIRPRTSLEKEAFILKHLDAAFQDRPLPVPRALGYGKELSPYGQVEYICMSRVPGVCVQNSELAGPDRLLMLRELGALLRSIHSVPQDALIRCGLIPGDRSNADITRRLEEKFADAAETLQNSGLPWPGRHSLKTISSVALRALPQDGPPALTVLHSNPGPTHTFIDPVLHTFSGLIDFGDAYVSHPAFDLVRWPDPVDRGAVLKGYLDAPGSAALGSAFVTAWRMMSILSELQRAVWDPGYLKRSAGTIDDEMDLVLEQS